MEMVDSDAGLVKISGLPFVAYRRLNDKWGHMATLSGMPARTRFLPLVRVRSRSMKVIQDVCRKYSCDCTVRTANQLRTPFSPRREASSVADNRDCPSNSRNAGQARNLLT